MTPRWTALFWSSGRGCRSHFCDEEVRPLSRGGLRGSVQLDEGSDGVEEQIRPLLMDHVPTW